MKRVTPLIRLNSLLFLAFFLTLSGVATRSSAADNVSLRFRPGNSVTGLGKAGLSDVTLISFRAPGRDRRQTVARDAGEGVYEAKLNLRTPGVYYVYVTVPSLKIGFLDFAHLSLRVREGK